MAMLVHQPLVHLIQRDWKQQDVSHFHLKPSTQGAAGIRGMEAQSGNMWHKKTLCKCPKGCWMTLMLIPTVNVYATQNNFPLAQQLPSCAQKLQIESEVSFIETVLYL